MNDDVRREPPRAWAGRSDPEEGKGPWRWHEAVQPLQAQSAPGLALLGFASDAGVVRNQGRPGAAEGPAALRRALANLPLLGEHPIHDAGDVRCLGDALESAQDAYAATVAELLSGGHRVIGLGGGHEIAYASFDGLARAVGSGHAGGAPSIGIVNLDAHFDLRAGAQATSGTGFRQIAEHCAAGGRRFDYWCGGISRHANTRALFERARSLDVHVRLDEDLEAATLPTVRADLRAFVGRVDHVYLTLCLDVLPAAVAPGVSAPAARGVPLAIVEDLLLAVATCGRLRLFDVAELCPPHDPDGRTARTAARLVGAVAASWA